MNITVMYTVFITDMVRFDLINLVLVTARGRCVIYRVAESVAEPVAHSQKASGSNPGQLQIFIILWHLVLNMGLCCDYLTCSDAFNA